METSIAPVVPPFRRRLLGYDRSEVDQFLHSTIAECRAQLEEARKTDMIRAASGEIAGLLRTFAESVAVMHDDAERKAAETMAEAETKAAGALANAHADAARIRDEAVTTARAATEEAEARKADSERALSEARLEAERVLAEAQRQAAAIVTASSAEIDTRFKAISAQRMMTEHEVARAAEHLAGVLSALRSLDRLTVETAIPTAVTEPATPPAGAADDKTAGEPEPPPSVDLSEERAISAALARWAQTH